MPTITIRHIVFLKTLIISDMNQTKIFIGIDPGLKGGIAILIPDKPPLLSVMPLLAKVEIDVKKVLELIYIGRNVHIIIEDVHSIFGASASANFSFGFGCGSLFTVLKLANVPFTKVSPKQWQKEMWQGVKPIEINTGKKNKDGSPKYKIDTKATSLLSATRLFPNINFMASERSKIPHDGIIDSLLMAEYGRRKNY
jgi:hypothetical protein